VKEEIVLQSFSEAEFSSLRHRNHVTAWASMVEPNRVLSSSPSTWSIRDRQVAASAVRLYRGPILGQILSLSPTWYEAIITPDELPSLRVISFGPFDAIARDRKLGTLTAAMDAGKETPGDGFSTGYRELTAAFDINKVRGRPSVLARDRSGPFVVFEGLTRLAVLTSRRARKESIPEAINLYLGITPRAPEWRFFGEP
jgi:hypothetical protein